MILAISLTLQEGILKRKTFLSLRNFKMAFYVFAGLDFPRDRQSSKHLSEGGQ
jgi:hypothetical protein